MNDSEDGEEDAEEAGSLFLLEEDVSDLAEGISLDEFLILAGDSLSVFHFLFHSKLLLAALKFEMLMLA